MQVKPEEAVSVLTAVARIFETDCLAVKTAIRVFLPCKLSTTHSLAWKCDELNAVTIVI